MVSEALKQGCARLKKAGIPFPYLDTEVLLADVLKTTKERIVAHPEKKLTQGEEHRFFSFIRRRAAHEPLAYITGHKEFYGLDFKVNKNTLIPRPETELLVEAVLAKLPTTYYLLPTTLIDVGTGSGAIAVTLARKIKDLRLQKIKDLRFKINIYATDVSNKALQTARANARHHGVKVTLLHGDLLFTGLLRGFAALTTSRFTPRNDLILIANLPYLPTQLWKKTAPEIKKYEPRTALDGGPDGLKYYHQLFKQIQSQVSGVRCQMFLEFDPSQTRSLTKLTKQFFPNSNIEIKKDLAGKNRVMILTLCE